MLVFQISKRRDSFIIARKIPTCKLFATCWPIYLNTVGTIFRYQPIWDIKPQPMLGNSNKMYHIYCRLLLCISSTTDKHIDFSGKLIIHVFLILSNVCIFSSLLCTKIMLIILWSYIYPNLILDANLSLRHFLVHSFFNKHTQYKYVSNCYFYCKKKYHTATCLEFKQHLQSIFFNKKNNFVPLDNLPSIYAQRKRLDRWQL